MSLYNDASLVMIPSAYKDGKLYSIKPTDGSGDFTFSRGSNLAATRVNENGLIEKGRENLILQSNQFDTTWVSLNTTETGGQSGYNGANDAWLLTKSSASAYMYQNVSSGLRTASIYAKSGSLNWIYILKGGNTGQYFNLSNGVLGSSTGPSPIDANIEYAGSGWYRCSLTYTDAFSGSLRFYPADGDLDTSGTSGSIYIQDAQLEQGLVATDYIETTSTTAQAGILEDMPRLDYSGGASCPSLKLEPQRLNKISNSEYFGDSSWNNSNEVTRSISSTLSPEGKLNAYDIVPTTANTNHTLRAPNLSGFTSGAVVNVSFFAKANGYKFISVVGGFGSSSTPAVVFNLDEGTITSGTGTIEDYGSGWYRCVTPITLNATALYCVGTILNDNESGSFAGDGTSGISVYGYQIEEASYPTSYIPTYGTSVTRSADSCLATSVSDLIGQEQGTLFFDYVYLGLEAVNQNWFAIQNTTATDRILFYSTGNSNNLRFLLSANGSALIDNANLITETAGTRYKVAVSYISGAVNIFINGTKIIGYTTDFTFANDMSILTFKQANQQPASKMNQSVTFPTALTDSECIALTTL